MASWNDGIQGSAWTHALAIYGAIALDVGLGQPLAIDEYVSPWIHHNPLTGQGYNPLDVCIAGRVGNPWQAAQERQIHQQATQGIGA